MPDMTYTSVAFYGNKQQIIEIYSLLDGDGNELDFNRIKPIPDEVMEGDSKMMHQWMTENWGTTWCEKVKKKLHENSNSHMLEITLITPWNPPLGVFDCLCDRYPGIQYVLRFLTESELNEVTVIKRDFNKVTRTCLIDYPWGMKECTDDTSESTIEVNDEFIMELTEDQQLCDAAELIGVTIDRINQRKQRTLTAI